MLYSSRHFSAYAAGPTGPGVSFNWNAPKRVILAAANSISCVIKADKTLKCWGSSSSGQTGKGTKTNDFGDAANEMGANLTPISLGTGRTAKAVAVGGFHTCAILDDDTLKCWGESANGQLGLGTTTDRGDGAGEMGDSLPTVDLGTGRTAKSLALGLGHSCAILDNNTVKCWGFNSVDGELGLGDTTPRGDGAGEMGDSLPVVNLGTGRTALQISTGGSHTCAVLDNNTLKCWGYNLYGQLGQGDTNSRGGAAGEMGDSLAAISLGTGRTAKFVTSGQHFNCAILDNDTVKCWGRNQFGQLGQGDTTDRGDGAGEMGDSLPAVNLGTGRTAKAIRSFWTSTCAILDNDTVKCWGGNAKGELGQGNVTVLGDGAGEMGDSLPTVDLGTRFVPRAFPTSNCRSTHNCVISTTDGIKCWGDNLHGEQGIGNNNVLGDGANEMGDNLLPISF